MPFNRKISRRSILLGSAASVAVSAVGLSIRPARAADSLTVADPGGPFKDAYGAAFYKPYEEKTGLQIVNVAREHQPTSQVQAIVDTGNYSWDVVTITQGDEVLLHDRDLLEPLDWDLEHMGDIMKEARAPDWMGVDVYATILAIRSDHFKDKKPSSWADFWDVENFPGRRALRKSPIDTLEIALLADGVTPDELYPLDLDRAFKKLTEIRPDIDVWWTGGAQTSQMLQSGEVDMLPTWNGRAQTVIDADGTVEIVWNQGLYSIEGWAIPKGSPASDEAKKFIAFCADPKRQAEYTKTLAYGPTNPKAYDYIPPERAKFLPTAPAHFDKLILASQEWWGENKEEAEQRFNEWLLS
ncbi:ABC transporter substrate-binding protein [Afifella marina]|uniref:Putative spermidine/putrescine transport system substrate-binding protein n=1 Tax=Afifella marina DSM 2698 TaxID=1120955 RepID=A0A1G5MDB2_AFIMA|nr:ABC transporter substrate-binding protein [Afifella marina]MBK1622598.1 ABC transporter substrate-binding protein [Afifella marina DSM 2698]MBK1625593.1 ABC transporter substrate-binding protein [Afifella marina]MBK5917416.1 ABC transporter substrate-binding protein [Afifella marina]RAI23366.1 ABC transporter substrate-binding protein [Afifella marina DSM 2698]SCZ23155.1 putative spermidine/putrescine transport system substrate-binding protein [Afifella marina DSM 2698]